MRTARSSVTVLLVALSLVACAASTEDEAIAEDEASLVKARCRPQRAMGAGACESSLGRFIWDGVRCYEAEGCFCAGPDCAKTYTSRAACERAKARCTTPSGIDRATYSEDLVCGQARRSLAGECLNANGTLAPDFCCQLDCLYAPPDAPPPQDAACRPQRARGRGTCESSLGVSLWDGVNCYEPVGCFCAGPDCGAAFATHDECVAAHASCTAPAGIDPATFSRDAVCGGARRVPSGKCLRQAGTEAPDYCCALGCE